jgi:tetratricopeptide (TPR) repeat protein
VANDVDVINNKGWALNELGRYQEAIPYFDRALAIDPDYVHALNNKRLALDKLQ